MVGEPAERSWGRGVGAHAGGTTPRAAGLRRMWAAPAGRRRVTGTSWSAWHPSAQENTPLVSTGDLDS
jgi:hypothetical protein